MDGERTDQVFVTMWRGKSTVIPLVKSGSEIVPEGFLEGNDVELVRRWMDYTLATDLRSRGVRIVSPSLLMAGTVVPDRPAYHQILQ